MPFARAWSSALPDGASKGKTTTRLLGREGGEAEPHGRGLRRGAPHHNTAASVTASRTSRRLAGASSRRGLARLRGRAARDVREALADAPVLAREVERRGVAVARGPWQGSAPRSTARARGPRARASQGLGRRRGWPRASPPGSPAERRRPRGHLVEDRSERELVGAVVEGQPARLLGRHVAHRARARCPPRVCGEGDSGQVAGGRSNGCSCPSAVAAQLDEAEVEDLHEAVVGDHDVLGLQVAVDDAGGVGLGQAVRDLARDVQRRRRPSGRPGEIVAQAAAVDQLHHDVGPAGLSPNSWMVTMLGWLSAEAARASRSKRLMRPGRRRLLGEELDRDVAVQLVVARAPDLAHPPLPSRESSS